MDQEVATDADPTDAPAPVTAGDDARGSGLSLVQVVVLVAAIAFLAGAAGYLLGDRSAGPPESDVDTGFLQDMIAHHEQAVSMASVANGSASDDLVRDMAREVLISQRYEIGLMDGYLFARDQGRGDPERDAMGWMGGPGTAVGAMPGMATEDQLDALQEADPDGVNLLFLELMTAHHRGGIDMAEYAARNAESPEIRELAEIIARVQRQEVREYELQIEELSGG